MTQTKGCVMNLTHIPLSEVREDALLRDRAALDPTALHELTLSIFSDGLHQPIEVWPLNHPTETHRYGLITGLRRLTAFRALQSWPNPDRFATIPAFVLPVTDLPHAMATMVAENEIRAPITPWEKGALLVECVRNEIFPTLDAAVDALYPALTRHRRNRLRSLALVAEECEGLFTTPETLTVQQMERLASALRGGLAPVIAQILGENRGATPQTQWTALLPTLREALDPEIDEPNHPTRPRRLLHLTNGEGLTLRRERLKSGWALLFTGPEARKGGLMDDVMDMVERMLGKRG